MRTRVLDIGNIDLPGSGYPPLAAFRLPSRAQLAGAFLLGTGAETGLTDWSGQAAEAVAVGSPDWQTGYVALNGTNYLQTDVTETRDMTLVACVQSLTDLESCFIGGWAGPGNAGVAILRFAENRITGLAGLNDSSHQTGVATGVTRDQWAVCAVQVGNTSIRVTDYTSGQSSGVVNYAGGATRQISASAHPYRLGRGYTPSYVNPVRLNSALIYRATLTADNTRAAARALHSYAQNMLGLAIPFTDI